MTSFNDRRVWPQGHEEHQAVLAEHFGAPQYEHPEHEVFSPTRHASLGLPTRTTTFENPYRAGQFNDYKEGPPVYVEKRVINPKFGPHGMREPTGETAPISHVYRGMHPDEWAEAQKTGVIRSTGKGAIIPAWEGTNAGTRPDTAAHYLPEERDTSGGATGRKVPGSVVAKIAVHPDEDWFTSDLDSYIRTRKAIPVHRVEATMTFAPPDWSDRRSSAEDH